MLCRLLQGTGRRNGASVLLELIANMTVDLVEGMMGAGGIFCCKGISFHLTESPISKFMFRFRIIPNVLRDVLRCSCIFVSQMLIL